MNKINKFYFVSLIYIFSNIISARTCENEIKNTANSCYSHPKTIKDYNRFGDIVWNNINEQEGTVEVQFNLALWKNFTDYTVTLSVNESIKTQSDCTKNAVEYAETHTEIDYKRYYENHPKMDVMPCGKRAKITLKYIFTGCYLLKIKPKKVIGKDEYTDMPKESRKFLRTRYNKGPNEVVHVSQQYRTDDSSLILVLIHPYLPSVTQLYAAFFNISNKYQHINYNLIRVTNTTFENCMMEHEADIEISSSAECYFTKEDRSGKAVECRFKGIKTGAYNLIISFIDAVRCEGNSIWGKCMWTLNITSTNTSLSANPKHEGVKKSAESGVDPIVVILSLLAFLVLCVVILLLSWKRFRKIKSLSSSLISYGSRTPEEEYSIKPQILLLYARDSPLFMDVMKALRDLITSIGECDVYDIYDDSRFEEIAEDPEGWICDKLHNEFCKTTLVLTCCGFLQTGITVSNTPAYKNPHCYDVLFAYAMRQLIEFKNLHSYTKLFVANLSFDRNDYVPLNVLNPFTRYGLPTNLDTLLSDLFCMNVDHSAIVNSTEYATLLEKYNIFETYCKTNSDYIKDILNVDIRQE